VQHPVLGRAYFLQFFISYYLETAAYGQVAVSICAIGNYPPMALHPGI
jgi:hypothetical protein